MNAPSSVVHRMAVHDGATIPAPSPSHEATLPCTQPSRGSGSCLQPELLAWHGWREMPGSIWCCRAA